MSVPRSSTPLVAPRSPHCLDLEALAPWLLRQLPGHGRLRNIEQFQGGQSNPTYLLTLDAGLLVLRKQPPGALLPSAHQIDREYRIIKALYPEGIPVPEALAYCEDQSLIGTAFYVMGHVDGQIFHDTSLSRVTKSTRSDIYHSFARTLAQLHRLDPDQVGLGDFGRREDYCRRQVERWSKQYLAAKTNDIPAMDALMAWLNNHPKVADETAIAHGDYRLGNLIFAHDRPEILGILDWELATLGHPLADLAYAALPYYMPDNPGIPGLRDADLSSLGIPSLDDFVETYRRASGRTEIPNWTFFVALSLFRLTAIAQGVYARSLGGNASDPRATLMGDLAKMTAEVGFEATKNPRA